jgi:hypothetical protein
LPKSNFGRLFSLTRELDEKPRRDEFGLLTLGSVQIAHNPHAAALNGFVPPGGRSIDLGAIIVGVEERPILLCHFITHW